MGADYRKKEKIYMPILAATPQPDYIALAIVVVLLGYVAFLTVRKYMHNKKCRQLAVKAPPAPPAPKPELPAAPGSAGQLKLHSVEPKTAAMLMAIVADKTGKPLNELRFISIREVEN